MPKCGEDSAETSRQERRVGIKYDNLIGIWSADLSGNEEQKGLSLEGSYII
jgi:hypothetical protein